MATSYKYLPHATAAVFAGGIGVGAYFAFVDRIYKKDPPGSDFKDDLDEFLRKLREWLESQIPGHNPPGNNPPGGEPGTPDPGTDPDSPTYQSFSTSSHQDGGASFEQTLAHVPVELWALVAVAVVMIAVAYHFYGQEPKSKLQLGR